MVFVRLYTGADGQSHFEDLDLHTWPADWSIILETAEIRFRHRPPGHFWDWHNESRRQYSIILSGQIEAVVGDGVAQVVSVYCWLSVVGVPGPELPATA